MKTSIIISAVLIGISALAFATNEKPVSDTTSINPGQFYGIIVNNNANIILTQGNKYSVRIEGEKSAINNTHTEIQNGALVINGQTGKVNIYITFKEISMIEVNGAGKIFGVGTINSDILLLKSNDNGSMMVDVRALKVGMIAKGQSKIIVSGSTGESYIKEFGKGKIISTGLNSYSQVEDQSSDEKQKREQL